MLSHLSIVNYAIIEQAELEFSPHLNVIIGETGAGKSIIMGALGLILGKRADTSILLDTEKKCVVEAKIDLADDHLNTFFEEHDLDYENVTIIRREINSKGKSRAFVNDQPVTLEVLRELTAKLIDIHSQHETRELEDATFFIKVCDQLAGNQELIATYQTTIKEYRALLRKIRQMTEEAAAFSKEYDFVKYQYEELDSVSLSEEAFREMEEEIELLGNADTIQRNLEEGIQLLHAGQLNAEGFIADAVKLLGGIAGFHPQLQRAYETLADTGLQLRELSRELQTILHNTGSDEGRLQELLEIHSHLQRLMHKHQVRDIGQLIALKNELAEKLEAFSFSDEKISELEEEADALEVTLKSLASQISEQRKKVALPFIEGVSALLADLGMPFAKVDLQFAMRKDFDANGLDDITLLFAPNKGSKLQTLDNVGSGGERSRLMLAIKKQIAHAMHLPTLIFDEIDTGISGEVAFKAGQLMKSLGKQHQIITITHLPQIAAGGERSFLVFKNHEKAHSLTQIRQLDHQAHTAELAKMLSGRETTDAALEQAKALIKSYES